MKNRIKEIRESAGLTQDKLAQIVGTSRSAISMYEINKSEPDFQLAKNIANYFDVSIDFLFGGEIRAELMFEEKLRLLRMQQGLTPSELGNKLGISPNLIIDWEYGEDDPNDIMLQIIAKFFNTTKDFLLGRETKIDNNIAPYNFDRSVVKIKIYGEIPAGVPVDMFEDIVDEEEIPTEWLKGGAQYFGLKVKGDSMLPKFENGDTIILKRQEDCESGQYCAISINGTESTFKRVIKSAAGLTLQPLNPAYELKMFSTKEVAELPITILGVVVEVRRKF